MGAARVFFKWTPGESSGSTHKTRHLNPSPWQCYSLYWQMRHELISSEEGEGGEGRGKAAALACVVRVDNRASVAHVAVTPAV